MSELHTKKYSIDTVKKLFNNHLLVIWKSKESWKNIEEKSADLGQDLTGADGLIEKIKYEEKEFKYEAKCGK